MSRQRWIQRSVPFAAVALVAAAPMMLAQGQGQELFEWNGRVDREVQITMRGNNLWTTPIGQTEPGRARSRAMSVLPRQDGQVTVQLLNGRGNVDVIQQPNAQNGYTTTIRIQDPRGGADNYRLVAYYQAYSNGEYIGADRGRGRGRDRDRDRDDVYDNRGRRDNGGYNNGRNGQNGQNGQYGQYGNQTALHWSGNVDDELEIRIQNGQMDYRTVHGAQPTSIRADRGSLNMPRTNATLTVVQNQGRGSVSVIQQPAAWNGYTTVIRVKDPQGGYGFYDFNLIWQ
jgi:hypothetical protein